MREQPDPLDGEFMPYTGPPLEHLCGKPPLKDLRMYTRWRCNQCELIWMLRPLIAYGRDIDAHWVRTAHLD